MTTSEEDGAARPRRGGVLRVERVVVVRGGSYARQRARDERHRGVAPRGRPVSSLEAASAALDPTASVRPRRAGVGAPDARDDAAPARRRRASAEPSVARRGGGPPDAARSEERASRVRRARARPRAARRRGRRSRAHPDRRDRAEGGAPTGARGAINIARELYLNSCHGIPFALPRPDTIGATNFTSVSSHQKMQWIWPLPAPPGASSLLLARVAFSEKPTTAPPLDRPPALSGRAMGRSGPSSRGSGRAGDALETRLENGCSTHGLDDVPPETRAAVLALRASWKFFSVQSFCHTFRAVLRLPNFTGDELERALMDPASEPFIVEVILRLLEDAPSRGPRLAVNDWEARLADKIQRIANESDYFEEDYPPTTVAAPSEEVADDVAPEGAAEAEGEDAPREEEDAPSSLSGPASSSTSEEAVVYGHPLQNGRAFFEHLTAMERLDVVAALCEECLDANEASRAEVEAMAAAHAVADGAHPEAHGDAVATDAENRAYHACGEDVRLYRWERPTGKGKNNARGGSLDPAFATPCVTLGEVRALAASLGDPPARKDRALRDYLLQHHIPPHEALEAKAERELAEAARRRTRGTAPGAEAYDATDANAADARAQDRRGPRAEEDRGEAEEEAEVRRSSRRGTRGWRSRGGGGCCCRRG